MKSGSILKSDQEIIALFFARDEQAIRETDLKYRSYLLSVAKNFIHDSEDAEECLNDTYFDVWQKIPPARPSHLKSFLAVIARRCAIDRFKEKTAGKRLPPSMAVPLSELEEVLFHPTEQHELLEAKELATLISRFLKGLPEHSRYLFLSRYYDGKPTKTIAREEKRSVSTVNKELKKLRSDLKDYLTKEGYPV